MIDVTVKVFDRGKLAGKYVVYFNTVKARNFFKSLYLELNGATHIMAGKAEDVEKASSFLTKQGLTVKLHV